MVGPVRSIAALHSQGLAMVSLVPVRHLLLLTSSQMRSACQIHALFRSQRRANESQFSEPDSDHASQRQWFPDIRAKLFRGLPARKYPGGLLVRRAPAIAVRRK